MADDTTPARLAGKPTWLISQTAAHAHRLLSGTFAAAGARGYHYRLLAALEEFGPASQASLGRRSGIDRSDVVAALNELGDRGLVERVPDPADHRRNIVTVTPAGVACLHRLESLVAGVQGELLVPLSPDERDELIRLLARVLAHHAGP
ncbi:MAG: MarR family winged helix-turn-helix transcriptional regulator [Streptosporangiaceae bacterium]